MARLILALDPALEDRLLGAIVDHGHAVVARLVGWHDVIESLEVLAPDVVLVSAARGALSRELLDECDVRGVRVIALAADSAQRAHATRVGLHEVLDARSAWGEIETLVSGGVAVPSRVGAFDATAKPAAAVIAVWGPAGAPGRTTLAINVAAELAAAGHRVALVDADPYGGAIAPALGLLDEAPGFASACRLAGANALDRSELERVAQRYTAPRAAFDVYTGLIGPSRWPELSASRTTAALAAIRANSEYVVIDTGFCLELDEEIASDQFAPRRNAATIAALEAADRVVLVGLGDPIGLSRLLRAHNELGDTVDVRQIDVVVNRLRSRAIGLDAHAQVRQTLRRFAGLTEATLLPHDGKAADAAVLMARSLRDAAAKSPLRIAIRDYVYDQLLPHPEPDRRRRLAPLRRRRARAESVAG